MSYLKLPSSNISAVNPLHPSIHFQSKFILCHNEITLEPNKQARPRTITKSHHHILYDLSTGIELSLNASDVALPIAGVSMLSLLAAKFATYSQLEVVRTSMLSRHVKKNGDARVLQLGGTTRDLFYYPQRTVQITVGGPDVSISLWEQAGMTAKIPVRAIKNDIEKCLAAAAGSSFDSVVSFDQFQPLNNAANENLLKETFRVLKPGGTFIFIQRIEGNAISSLLRATTNSNTVAQGDIGDKILSTQEWDFCQYDIAADGLDPHVVGVAVKPLLNSVRSDVSSSVDKEAFEQVMKAKKKKGMNKNNDKKMGGFGL